MNINILTMAEKDTLFECEKIIERGQQTFVEVGLALTKIRDRKLYRAGYATFDEYCAKRWGWTRQRAYQLIGAVEAVRSLPPKMSTVVDTERAARSLAAVPEEHRAAVVESAAATGRVTARTIEVAAEKIVDAEVVHRDLTECEREIPAAVLPLWQEANRIVDELLPLARKLKHEIKTGVENKEQNLIWIDATNGDTSPIQATINLLTLTVKPFAVCYRCHGVRPKQCKLCRGRGFIGRHLWTTCPAEEKAVLMKKGK